MEEEWKTIAEDYILIHPNPPRAQQQLSQKQADAISQMVQENEVHLHQGHRGDKILQVGSRIAELGEDRQDSDSRIKVFWHESDKNHAVSQPGLLIEQGIVGKAYRYDFEKLRPRSFGQLKGLGEEEIDHNLDESSVEIQYDIEHKLTKSKSKSKPVKKQKDTAKAVAEFTARCLKDLKRKLIKENALRKTTRAKKILLMKGKRARVVKIEVEKVAGRG